MVKKNVLFLIVFYLALQTLMGQDFNNLEEMQKLVQEPRHKASCFNFADGGTRYDFILWNGIVHYYKDNQYFGIFRPDGSSQAQMISYTIKIEGEKKDAPLFDMIAADNNRVIAKVSTTGTDVYRPPVLMWAQIVDEFPEELAESRALQGEPPLSIPGFYTKLNPESSTKRPDNWKELDNYYNHPAVKNFKKLKDLPSQINSDAMMVVAPSKIWHQIDARPPINSNNDFDGLSMTNNSLWWPTNFIEMNTLKWGLTAVEHFIQIYEVIDIGVANPHRYEHVKTFHGGRIHSYQFPKEYENFDSMALSEDFLFIPGDDVVDGGGFSDGTCNFYMLAKIKINKNNLDLNFIQNNPGYEYVYAVLWLDEQEYFSERWRLVHPVDHLYNVFRGGLVSVFSVLANINNGTAVTTLNPYFFNFTNYAKEYWVPYALLDENSRLAVSRYGLFVTGDSKIYSTAYMWGTTDFNWRGRSYPQSGSYDRNTLRVRDDMTLIMEGSYDLNNDNDTDDPYETGYWYQKFLPADNQLDNQCNLTEYNHSWRFVSNEVYPSIDSFFKFGVYDPDQSNRTHYKYKGVDDRCQYYQIKNYYLDGDFNNCTGEELDSTIWDTGEVNPNFAGVDKDYQETVKVRFKYDPILGAILLIDHPRDDDIDKDSLVFLNNRDEFLWPTPMTLHYVSGGNFNSGSKGTLKFTDSNLEKVQDWEAPVVQTVTIKLTEDLVSAEIVSKTTEGTADKSLRKASIGVIQDNGVPDIIAEFIINPNDFDGNVLSCNLDLSQEQNNKLLRYCYSKIDRYQNGVSIWFEDVTGHKNTAEELRIIEEYPEWKDLEAEILNIKAKAVMYRDKYPNLSDQAHVLIYLCNKKLAIENDEELVIEIDEDEIAQIRDLYNQLINSLNNITNYKKFGPVGGNGGESFDAKLTINENEKYRRLYQIISYQGNVLDSLQFVWKNDSGELFKSKKFGGGGGSKKVITFDENEYIKRVEVVYGLYIDKMILYTNKRSVKIGGNPLFFSSSKAYDFKDRECHGFFGKAKELVDKIGFYTYTREYVGRE